MAAAVRKMQQDPCIFPLYRLGFYGDSQLTAQFSAQIQADACGLPIVPAVGSGKSFIKNASDLTVLYANTVVFQEQRSPVVFLTVWMEMRQSSPFLYLTALRKIWFRINSSHLSSQYTVSSHPCRSTCTLFLSGKGGYAGWQSIPYLSV